LSTTDTRRSQQHKDNRYQTHNRYKAKNLTAQVRPDGSPCQGDSIPARVAC
jgi:hypothetical protein